MLSNKKSQLVLLAAAYFVTASGLSAATKKAKNVNRSYVYSPLRLAAAPKTKKASSLPALPTEPATKVAAAPTSASSASVTANPTSIASTIKADEKTFSPSLTGMIDIRPGYYSKSGMFDTENAAELGVKLTPNISLSYLQAFNSNLYNPSDTTSGTQAVLNVGYIKGKFNNIWQSADKATSLSYEQRIYIPTAAFQQDAGMIVASRNYFKLGRKLNDTVKLTLMEIPILFLHNSSGVKNAANAVFENRVYFITDVNITKNLSLSVPVMFHQTRFANYKTGATRNDSWTFHVWVNPELDYAINDNVTVGISYYNNPSLFAADLSSSNFANGFEDGVYQAVLTLTF